MTSLVSFLIYLPLFLLCLVSETKRNKRWKNIILPNKLQTIGSHVFECCSSLESIIIPNNVTKIGEAAASFSGDFDIPQLAYSPFAIFANKVPMFDINFFNPKTIDSKITPIQDQLKLQQEKVIYENRLNEINKRLKKTIKEASKSI